MTTVKRIQYRSTNSYMVLNKPGPKTRYVWLVFHGMGYLSKYFIRYFDGLDPEQHFIIAPQAPSKYYQDNTYKHVGASWLTREDTKQETKNVLAYVDAVYRAEVPGNCKLIIMGYSQGVSIATRWLAHSHTACHQLILHSGGIPKELEAGQFEFLLPDCPVDFVYGDQDPYINPARIELETQLGTKLFGARFKLHPFKGGHEVNRSFIGNSYKL